jgi:triphosphoribosyl-dephospho-CoA synthetase
VIAVKDRIKRNAEQFLEWMDEKDGREDQVYGVALFLVGAVLDVTGGGDHPDLVFILLGAIIYAYGLNRERIAAVEQELREERCEDVEKLLRRIRRIEAEVNSMESGGSGG